MSRVHDMGGRFGDGSVEPEAERPVFHEDWHARALALTLAAGSLGQWNLDISRHSRERLSPQDYTRFTYYEKWIAALTGLLVEKGVVTRSELEAGQGDASDLAERKLAAMNVPRVLATGGPADRPSDVPVQFAVGDAVLTAKHSANTRVDGGHTRLPTYAAGARGTVLRCHGCHVLPDANAHGFGESPEPLYAVEFSASQLWEHPENPQDTVILDLWQSYLVAAP